MKVRRLLIAAMLVATVMVGVGGTGAADGICYPDHIDIKPGSYPNNINLNGNGKVAVAVLTLDSVFDPANIDPSTATFGATGYEASPVNYNLEDVDGDSDLDLLLHFKKSETGLQSGDTVAYLVAYYDGEELCFYDSVRIR